MSIEYNDETKTLTIDPGTYKRLTEGTNFQRSMNALAQIDEAMAEMQDILLATLPKGKRKAMRKQLRMKRAEAIKKNPGKLDRDAIEIFYT